jgi:hypothetical protein
MEAPLRIAITPGLLANFGNPQTIPSNKSLPIQYQRVVL